MRSTISKLTLFTSLERNVFLLSSISLALFGIAVTTVELREGKVFCKIGAIFIALLAIYNIYIANDYLTRRHNNYLLKKLNFSANIYTFLLILLCCVFSYNVIVNHLL